MRALPRTLRDVTAPEGTTLQMTVTGPGAGEWACTLARTTPPDVPSARYTAPDLLLAYLESLWIMPSTVQLSELSTQRIAMRWKIGA